MPRKQFQFRISTLIWLIFASAVLFGTVRHIQRAYGNAFSQILAAACFLLPLVWLLSRPNPFRGRKRVTTPRTEPAGPMEQRLRQFMSNVARVEETNDSSSASVSVAMCSDTTGKPPRTTQEIGSALKRIQQSDPRDDLSKSNRDPRLSQIPG